MSVQDGVVRVPFEGGPAGQALEEDAAERVDVGARADRFPLDLLGGEAVDGAEAPGSLGQRRSGWKLLSQAEAEERDMLARGGIRRRGDEHLTRRETAVHEAPAPPRRIEGIGQLSDDRKRTLGGEPALVCEQAHEIDGVDVPHGDVQAPLCLTGLVDGDDVRMVERGGDLRLTQESLPEAHVGGELGAQEPERDPPVAAHVPGEVHDPQAAPAEQRLDSIASDLAADAGIDLSHMIPLRAYRIVRNRPESEPAGVDDPLQELLRPLLAG